jgi:hypothetical protein
MKWIMNNPNHFEAFENGYVITVVPFTDTYPYWTIRKQDEGRTLIDDARLHSPVTTTFNKELAAKVQAEQYFLKLTTNTDDVITKEPVLHVPGDGGAVDTVQP